MTSPGTVVVRPDALAALAEELTGLARELRDDADRCRSAAGALSTALDGDDGWTAGAAGSGWAALVDVLAGGTAALARTVAAAVPAYLAEDARIAGAMGRRRELPR